MTVFTGADLAELDALAWILTGDYFHNHRPNCAICQAAVEPCPHLQRAIAHVVEFRDARRLLTAAEELRLERAALLAALPDSGTTPSTGGADRVALPGATQTARTRGTS